MARPKAFKEEEVLERAVDLFWRRGFHSTSISQLVDHLGINRASLYDTFGGKEELFQKAFARYREKNKAILADLLQNSESVKQGFVTLFYTSLQETPVGDEQALRGCLAVNATAELLPEDEWLKETLEINRIEFEALFSSVIQAGQEAGEINASLSPEAVGSLLYTLYSGIKVITKLNGQSETLKAAIDTALMILEPA